MDKAAQRERIKRRYPREKPGLQFRIAIVVMAIVIACVLMLTYTFGRLLEDRVVTEGGERVMRVGDMVASDPRIVEAMNDPDPSAAIQPLAERIRLYTGTSFIVIMNMGAVRYSHPYADRIGKRFVGGDETRALAGERYLSKAVGTLGLSIRSFIPIRGPAGGQIGVASVGLLIEDINKSTRRLREVIYPAAAMSLLLGLGGAILLSRDIKRTIFGLEPHEIATLLEERNVIISSINEGIVAVDRSDDVILMNENARRLLSIGEGEDPIAAVAELGLGPIAAGGRAAIDEELALDGRVVLVNRIPLSSRGRTIGAIATFRDMSEVRALAEELTEVKQYTEALRAQHHEFLNKLHVVSGLIQLKKYSEAASYVVSTMAQKQRSFDVLRRCVRTPEIAALVLAKTDEAQELGIEVEIDEGSFFPRVDSEIAAPIIVIVGNLMQNSIESLKVSDRARKAISLSFSGTPSEVVISVRDNGKGIPPELRAHIFEKGASSKGRGRGRGLFLVKESVERLLGTIDIIEGEGLEMVVRLERAKLVPASGRGEEER